MRTVLRTVLAGFLVGALGLGSAWAGASLTQPAAPGAASADLDTALAAVLDGDAQVGDVQVGDVLGGDVQGAAPARPASPADAAPTATPPAEGAAIAAGERLPDGWFRAGTAVRSLVPPAERWKQADECRGQAPEQLYTPLTPDGCLITFDMRWADGVDEANPIEVRAAAIGNGEDAVVIAVMDVVGYMAAYPATGCADCGIAQITARLSDELGIPADRFVISSTHTHAAPTTIADGPTWYYEHVRDQVLEAIRAATADAAANPPVRVETGATLAKAFNTDRRIVDRAVPDYELGWLRAFVPAPGGNPGSGAGSGERTILTMGNFAVHPTIRAGNAELHSGFVGPFARRLNERLGGEGLFFPGGLGDQRVDRGFGVDGHGIGLADLIVDDIERGGHVLATNDIAVARAEVQIPVENQFFVGALATGYAVRDILPPFGGGPLAVEVRKGGANAPVCVGAGEVHVVGPVSAIRLGEQPPAGKVDLGPEYRLPVAADNVVLVQGPGEMFAEMGLIVKDALSRSSNVLFASMANDTLGYMMPANTYDLFASQGGGLIGNNLRTSNYEEALSLGRCSGEIVMKAMLELGVELGVMGEGEGP
jgi:hypothetical protein